MTMRSRAYRWNEDGIAGICDRHQMICFAIALWNGRDPILKERVFGLTGNEGNHGEDVKEYYFYLDSTPTHSYMTYLYKYPQAAFPYGWLVEENRRRGRGGAEFELLDTGVFDEDRYFDVVVEYAKAGVEDILIRISATNRGPESAQLVLLPTLWYRNTWSWGSDEPRPSLRRGKVQGRGAAIEVDHPSYGRRWLYCEGSPELLFTENETNYRRLYGAENGSPYVKDGINDYIVHGVKEAVNPERVGTKVAAHYPLTIAPGKTMACGCASPIQKSQRPVRRPSGPLSTRSSASGNARLRSFTRRSFLWTFHRTPAASCARRSRGSCGPSSSTTTW